MQPFTLLFVKSVYIYAIISSYGWLTKLEMLFHKLQTLNNIDVCGLYAKRCFSAKNYASHILFFSFKNTLMMLVILLMKYSARESLSVPLPYIKVEACKIQVNRPLFDNYFKN